MNRDLKTQIALQCAPLLTKIKISNLLIIRNEDIDKAIQIFKETQISSIVICERDKKSTFLLYRKNELISYLESREVKSALEQLGYDSFELNYILKEFSKRYSLYMLDKKEFPHEMGFLLGYPVDDVIGFIENEGKNQLYTGYWKVYSNLQESINLFEQYNNAKKMVIRMVSQGMSIQNILDIHYSNKFNKIAI